jgi:hypothetical protein
VSDRPGGSPTANAVKGCLKLARFVSTPVIENSEPNFRKGWILLKKSEIGLPQKFDQMTF